MIILSKRHLVAREPDQDQVGRTKRPFITGVLTGATVLLLLGLLYLYIPVVFGYHVQFPRKIAIANGISLLIGGEAQGIEVERGGKRHIIPGTKGLIWTDIVITDSGRVAYAVESELVSYNCYVFSRLIRINLPTTSAKSSDISLTECHLDHHLEMPNVLQLRGVSDDGEKVWMAVSSPLIEDDDLTRSGAVYDFGKDELVEYKPNI